MAGAQLPIANAAFPSLLLHRRPPSLLLHRHPLLFFSTGDDSATTARDAASLGTVRVPARRSAPSTILFQSGSDSFPSPTPSLATLGFLEVETRRSRHRRPAHRGARGDVGSDAGSTSRHGGGEHGTDAGAGSVWRRRLPVTPSLPLRRRPSFSSPPPSSSSHLSDAATASAIPGKVYLGGYDKEEKAARAYDLAALKYWGSNTTTNFPVAEYEKELEEMKTMTRQEFVASLRRKSSGFSRGASIYRGVTRHHQHGRWQARIGRVAGNKDLYLGTFSTEEEAAEAYDIAAIKFRGLNAVTNFEISRYNVESIMSSNIPMGSMSVGGRSNKALESPPSGSPDAMPVEASTAPLFAALPVKYDQQQQDYLSMLALQHHQQGNLQGLGFGLYSSGVNLDFANSHGTASSMTHCYVNGGTASSHQQHQHHQQLQDQQQCENETQQSSNSCSSLPFATPITFNGSYESSKTAGPFGYSYPNVAAFQTPIYGME